jgi:hypothetical protein
MRLLHLIDWKEFLLVNNNFIDQKEPFLVAEVVVSHRLEGNPSSHVQLTPKSLIPSNMRGDLGSQLPKNATKN